MLLLHTPFLYYYYYNAISSRALVGKNEADLHGEATEHTDKRRQHTPPVHIIVVTELSKSYHNEIKAVKFRVNEIYTHNSWSI